MASKTTPRSDSVQWDVETEESFYFMNTGYDVREAKKLLAAKARPIGQLPVSDVGPLVGTPDSFGAVIHVDWEAVAKADTSVPVLLAYSERGNLLPIDGYHRIAKAVLEGLETLPCVVLTKTESRKVYL